VQPVNFAYHNVDTVVDSLREKFDKLEFYLTGSGNFRHQIASIQGYKANRSPFSKPFHYEALREYLVRKYEAKIVDGIEADDALGIRQTDRSGDKTCIVSTDKDLDMIPGNHFNWVKGIKYYVEEQEGLRNFYKQCLTGDRVDNIPGIRGVGPVTAEKIIGRLSHEPSMYGAVRRTWAEHYPRGYEGRRIDSVIEEVAQLLWIQRTGRERWSRPI